MPYTAPTKWLWSIASFPPVPTTEGGGRNSASSASGREKLRSAPWGRGERQRKDELLHTHEGSWCGSPSRPPRAAPPATPHPQSPCVVSLRAQCFSKPPLAPAPRAVDVRSVLCERSCLDAAAGDLPVGIAAGPLQSMHQMQTVLNKLGRIISGCELTCPIEMIRSCPPSFTILFNCGSATSKGVSHWQDNSGSARKAPVFGAGQQQKRKAAPRPSPAPGSHARTCPR